MSKKIIYVIENFYPDYRAGTETYVLNLAKGFLAMGWDVSVIIASTTLSKQQVYDYEGISVFVLPVSPKITVKELNGLFLPGNLPEFKALLKSLQPDIVHFHSFSRSFTHSHIKASQALRIKTFFTAHLGSTFCARGDLQLFGKELCDAKIKIRRCSACYASQKYGLLTSQLGSLTALIPPLRHLHPPLNLIANKLQSINTLKKYADKNIVIARWIEKAFEINGLFNTVLMTQAIDTDNFTHQTSAVQDKIIHLGFVGRMNPSKGFHLLMEALNDHELRKKTELHVVTLRDNYEKSYYKQMQQKYERLGYTRWLEQLTHQELNREMDQWDMLCLPSTANEAAPLVILEANAKGIPVLGSDYPAIGEMIKNHQDGLIFRNKDANDLRNKLRVLLNNKALLKKFRQNITPPKDTDQLVEEHLNLYRKNNN